MGKIVINQTYEKQTVILTNDADGIIGVYFGEDGVEKPVGFPDNLPAFLEGDLPGAVFETDVTNIVGFAFQARANLEEFSAPECEEIGFTFTPAVAGDNGYTFNRCKKLKKVYLPKLKKIIGDYNFSSCIDLEEIALPSLISMDVARTFSGCTKLKVADLYSPDKITNQTFFSCPDIRTLVIRGNQVTPLAAWNVNALGGIFSNPTESAIYVPADMVDSYKAASNWSSGVTAGLTITSIEGSEYENQYADGTPIE